MSGNVNDLNYKNWDSYFEPFRARSGIVGDKILDGTGAGYEAEVTSNRELVVTSGSAFERARAKGDAYSWFVPTANLADNDTVLIVRNDSASHDLVIDHVHLYNGNVAECDYIFHIVKAVYASSGGGATIGTNLNSRFGNSADVTCDADETANVQGTIVMDYIALTAATTYVIKFGVALGEGHAFGCDQMIVSTAGGVKFVGYFVEREAV
jgi:hypothetical protein